MEIAIYNVGLLVCSLLGIYFGGFDPDTQETDGFWSAFREGIITILYIAILTILVYLIVLPAPSIPDMIIVLFGSMVIGKEMSETTIKNYPNRDFIFGMIVVVLSCAALVLLWVYEIKSYATGFIFLVYLLAGLGFYLVKKYDYLLHKWFPDWFYDSY